MFTLAAALSLAVQSPDGGAPEDAAELEAIEACALPGEAPGARAKWAIIDARAMTDYAAVFSGNPPKDPPLSRLRHAWQRSI